VSNYELERGEELTRGAHNKSVIHALRKEGKDSIADKLQAAGIDKGPKPVAPLSPKSRLQQERTYVSKADTARAVSKAWASSDSAAAFSAALQEQGLRLAKGDKCTVILDASGNTHSVTRLLAMDAKAQNTPAPKAADINARLQGMDIPSLKDAKLMPVITALAVIGPADDNPSPTLPGTRATIPSYMKSEGSSESLQTVSSGGDGGPESLTQPDANAFSADIIEGPGEPPGPGASPHELQMFRAKLMAYEDKKAAAINAAFRAQQGGNNHVVQTQAEGSTNGITESSTKTGDEGSSATNIKPASHRKTDIPRGISSKREFSNGSEFTGEVCGTNGNRKSSENRNPVTGGSGDIRVAEKTRDTARENISNAKATFHLETGLRKNTTLLETVRKLALELNPEFREARRIHLALIDDKSNIANILATNPVLDPRDLDPQERAARYAGFISDGVRERSSNALKAQAEALALASNRTTTTKLLSVFGIKTQEQRNIDKGIKDALKLTDLSENLPSRDDYSQARADGVRDAHNAQKALQAWRDRPEVAKALNDNRLNQVIQESIKAGDTEISDAMKAGDPELARSILRERERIQESRRMELERIAEITGKPPNDSGPKRR
jgi:hypothetical protein